jgi:hypothetical protein
VVLLSGDGHGELAQAHDAGHDAHRLARRVQNGPLLDVGLEERAKSPVFDETPGAIRDPRPRIGKAGAVRRHQRIGIGQRKLSRPHGRPRQRTEATFLILETHDRHRRPALFARRSRDLKRGDHAIGAVEPAALGLRIGM